MDFVGKSTNTISATKIVHEGIFPKNPVTTILSRKKKSITNKESEMPSENIIMQSESFTRLTENQHDDQNLSVDVIENQTKKSKIKVKKIKTTIGQKKKQTIVSTHEISSSSDYNTCMYRKFYKILH